MVPLFQGTMNVGAEITTPHPAPVNS
jgi:hypothetical protein